MSTSSPLLSNKAEAALSEIVFEAQDSERMKLFFLISPPETQPILYRRLASLLKAHETNISSFEASELGQGTLMNTLVTQADSKQVLCISGLGHLKQQGRHSFYAELNFHRDALLELPGTLLLCLTTNQMYELAATAPDLWSRRTSVFDLSEIGASVMITNLFKNSAIPMETWRGADSLSELLESLLAKEHQLATCHTNRSEVAISRAKECHMALLEIAGQLKNVAGGERRIELALWLWNLARLDDIIQGWIRRLPPAAKTTFEAIYLDRNEVLLQLAEGMPSLFSHYERKVRRALGTKRSMSIVDLFLGQASHVLEKISTQLEVVATADEYYEYESEVIRRGMGPDAVDITIDDLEKFLSGATRRRPKYLSDFEAELLKALYLGHPILEQANRFGANQDQMFAYIELLEKKMRTLFGMTSHLRRN